LLGAQVGVMWRDFEETEVGSPRRRFEAKAARTAVGTQRSRDVVRLPEFREPEGHDRGHGTILEHHRSAGRVVSGNDATEGYAHHGLRWGGRTFQLYQPSQPLSVKIGPGRVDCGESDGRGSEFSSVVQTPPETHKEGIPMKRILAIGLTLLAALAAAP